MRRRRHTQSGGEGGGRDDCWIQQYCPGVWQWASAVCASLSVVVWQCGEFLTQLYQTVFAAFAFGLPFAPFVCVCVCVCVVCVCVCVVCVCVCGVCVVCVCGVCVCGVCVVCVCGVCVWCACVCMCTCVCHSLHSLDSSLPANRVTASHSRNDTNLGIRHRLMASPRSSLAH